MVDLAEANDPFYRAFLSDKEKRTGLGAKPAESGAKPAELDAKPGESENCAIEGQILWQGSPPAGDKTWLAPLSPLIERRNTPVEPRENPFFPVIGSALAQPQGLAGVVVALVDGPVRPELAWPHGPLKVILRNHRLILEQDQGQFAVGFIRPEDAISIELESGDFDTIRGRGAAFFACPFLKPKDKATRQLRRPGIVRLASGAGHFWMQGLVIASPTPLIARTGADGKFRITGVPPGQWSLLCFRPSQKEKGRERDGETLETSLLDFEDPVVSSLAVRIGAANAPLRIAADDRGFTLAK